MNKYAKKNESYEITFIKRIRLFRKAGIKPDRALNYSLTQIDNIESIDTRIKKILGIVSKPQNATNMIYFIMYDIEDNKIRTQISKYLEKKGCVRIQKSIFLADTSRNNYTDIHQTVKEVNDMYENNDSIILTPISTDELTAMKLIGKNIDFDIITGNKSTLFF